MIFNLPDGTKREVPDDVMSKFISENGKPLVPGKEDFYRTALSQVTKEEYIKLCGVNPYIDLYIPELNRFLAARLNAVLDMK